MPHVMKQGMFYRMPIHFGPTPGPRQGPHGQEFDWTRSPKRTAASLSFLTERTALDAILPPSLELAGEPIVTIEIVCLTKLEWLAGRGYNTFGVRFPARFRGRVDDVVGSFLAVLWENLPDPILERPRRAGVQQALLRYSPAARVPRPSSLSRALARVRVLHVGAGRPGRDSGGADGPTRGRRAQRRNSALQMCPGRGARAKATWPASPLPPSAGSKAVIDRAWRGKGVHAFRPSSWEQLPTMFHVVNALANLPVIERRGALLTQSHGGLATFAPTRTDRAGGRPLPAPRRVAIRGRRGDQTARQARR